MFLVNIYVHINRTSHNGLIKLMFLQIFGQYVFICHKAYIQASLSFESFAKKSTEFKTFFLVTILN